MGKILVDRRSYYRKDGTYVRGTTYLMKDTGKPGRTPKSKRWFKVAEEGRLIYKGDEWHAEDSGKKRRRILRGLAKSRGWNVLIKRLNAVRNVSTSRKLKKSAGADIKWMQRQRG